jgi:hypothetical protein
VILLAAFVDSRQTAARAQQLILDLTGRELDPFGSTDAKAIVFLFIRSDCPISNRYAPEVRRLHEKFAPSGVTFWIVYSDPDERVETISEHVREYQYGLSVLRDLRHTLVRKTGVRVTPEAAVFVPQGRMVYRGRIDDRYVAFGKTRPAATTYDLERVLQAVVEGKPLRARTTHAIGCFITDLR